MGHELWKLHCSSHLSKWWSSSRALSFCMMQLANPPIEWNRSEDGRNQWLTTGSCCSTWKGSNPAACNISSLLTGRREMTRSSFMSIFSLVHCMYGYYPAILVVTNVLLPCAQTSLIIWVTATSILSAQDVLRGEYIHYKHTWITENLPWW